MRFCLAVALVLLSTALRAAEPAEQFRAARLHLQKGRVDEAREVYEELAKADAEPAQVAIGLSRCDRAVGDWKPALERLQATAKKFPKQAPLWAELAEVQHAHGLFDEARASVVQALKLDGESPRAHMVQANLDAETGHLTEADAEYRWFVRYYNKEQPKDAETLLLVAQGTSQYARWHSVPQIFDFIVNTLCPDALADEKESWQAYYISGSLLLDKFNREQALPEFKQALAINPRAAEALVALGNASLQQFELKSAAEFADRALEVNPRLVEALQLHADLKLNDGETQAALPLLQQALDQNPRDQRTLARIAACYLLEDGPPPAAELDPLLANLDAIAEVKLEKPSRFSELLIKLARANPAPGYFLAQLGETLEGRRKFDLAERFYKLAIKTMPQLSEPKTSLGMLYMRIGRTDAAREILETAFESDPYHVRVSNMRKVLKLLDSYEAITTEHFVIHVDSQADKLLGQYMAEYLEQEYPALVKQFGFEPPRRTQFEVYNKSKGLSAHQWFSARMIGLPWIQTIGASTGMIVALASPNAQERPFNWARVVKHEFIHILTLQETDFNIPHWFTEALATVNEGYERPATWNQLLIERASKGELMTLENLSLGFIRPKSPQDWEMAYCQSELYAQYMVEKFGPETLPKLLAAYRDNLTTPQAIRRAFGVELAEFEKGYLEYVQAIVAKLQAVAPEPKQTLAEVEKAHLADPDDVHLAARYALELLKVKRFKSARQLAEAVLEKNKAEPLAAVVMAQLALRAEDTDTAIKQLEAGLDRQRPHPELLELLGKLKLKSEQYTQAAELFQLGHDQDPANEVWLKGLAAAYLRLDDQPRLKQTLLLLVALDADDVNVRKKLAQMALADKNYPEAARYANMALQIDVLDPETHRMLGAAAAELKDHPRAVKEYAVAVELKPDEASLKLALARSQIAAGQKDQARGLLKQLLEKDPDAAEAQELLKTLK
jgi:tetratricopeptide (TPR) repeat protein